MSYLVLARKYRPRFFQEMVGQEHVVQALTNALTTQRLHHAYLFTGTRGVGKTTVSRILAKSLNCQGPDGQGGITATPCGKCQACSDIDAGRFVDYTELDAASNRGVDEVQALLEQAVYKPVQGRFKVFMIDEVHMLTNTAFNAMLKTLEEPPEYLKFVLATTDPQKVPVTVLSRCLQFNLRPMAPETIREHLTKVLSIESVSAEIQALRLLARAARGSMRDALSLTDQAIAFGSGALTEFTVRQMLGSVDRSYVFGLIEALAIGDGRAVVQTVEDLRMNGLSAGSALEEMATVLQRMAVLQAVGHEALDEADPEAADIARLAQLMPPDEAQLLYSICLHGRADLGLAPDEYAALTMVLLRLLAFKPSQEKKTLDIPERAQPTALAAVHSTAHTQETPTVSGVIPPGQVLAVRDLGNPEVDTDELSELSEEMVSEVAASDEEAYAPPWVDEPEATQEYEEPGSRHAPNLQVSPIKSANNASKVIAIPVQELQESPLDVPAAPRGYEPTEEGEFWHATVMQLVEADAITAMVRVLALQSQLIARDSDQWLLRIERESLNQPSTRERLTQALQAAGHAVSIAIEVGRVVDSPERRNAVSSAEKQQAAERIILQSPFVQSMMRDFGAKIVPGSIRPL
jgi:DNA polymerase-3 subunit gamma/tau